VWAEVYIGDEKQIPTTLASALQIGGVVVGTIAAVESFKVTTAAASAAAAAVLGTIATAPKIYCSFLLNRTEDHFS
jgi:Cys-tRNA synthase (O-phospho-L-seryl-tRNA:Cys-tRNA synthase)